MASVSRNELGDRRVDELRDPVRELSEAPGGAGEVRGYWEGAATLPGQTAYKALVTNWKAGLFHSSGWSLVLFLILF